VPNKPIISYHGASFFRGLGLLVFSHGTREYWLLQKNIEWEASDLKKNILLNRQKYGRMPENIAHE
jgi:hypothetical protein